MRFLERLAATALQRARGQALPGAAQVALPSRFAPPAGNDPRAASATPATGDAGTIDFDRPLRGAERQTPAHTLSAVEGLASAAHGAGSASVEGSRVRSERAVAPLPIARARLHAAPDATAIAGAGRENLHDPGNAARLAHAAPGNAGSLAQPASGDAGAAIGSARPIVHRPQRASVPQHAPLREAALAARMAPRRDEHQVVHVTIDRIDVRAAPHERTIPRARPQPSPSISLAEYLRRRGRDGDAA